jgi:hypothetical protein
LRPTVFFLGGGPGVSNIKNKPPEQWLKDFDVVVLEYRGVGRSSLVLKTPHFARGLLRHGEGTPDRQFTDLDKTGNSHARRLLTEAAWNYHFKPRICRQAQQRQQNLPEHILGATAQALAFYGGVPQFIAPDNPRALVTAAERYEPVLTQTVQDFARHYGCSVLPARLPPAGLGPWLSSACCRKPSSYSRSTRLVPSSRVSRERKV